MGKAKPEAAGITPTLWLTWVLAASVVLLAVVVRIRLLGMPLERDEGEFAYMGQLILEGIPPYKLAYSMKLPGTCAVYALIMSLFGQTDVGIHLGLLLANLSAAVMVYFLGGRLWSTSAGLIAGAAYSILTLGRLVIGTAGHCTQFLVPMVLGALLILLKALEEDRPRLVFWSGLLMGLAFVTKQHAVFFGIFGVCWLLWDAIRVRKIGARAVAWRAAVYAAGAVIPFALTCLVMYLTGVFDRFWFWTITYAREYTSEATFSEGLRSLYATLRHFGVPSAALVGLSLMGVAALIFSRRRSNSAPFVIGLLACSLLAVCPGFYFRRHYWIQVMPAVSLLAGVGIAWLSAIAGNRRLLRSAPLLLFAAAVVLAIAGDRTLFLAATPKEACRALYAQNPFPESLEVARYLRERSSPGDRIAVLGSEPEIYFYAHRLSATGHIYMYGLMERHRYAEGMHEETIREIEAAAPRYIVYVSHPESWLRRPDSYNLVLTWGPKYCGSRFTLTGVTDSDPADANYPGTAHAPQACIYVYERNPGM